MTAGSSAARLTIARKLKGYSKSELASATGVSHTLISQVESGAKPMTPDLRARLSVALRCSERFLGAEHDRRPLEAYDCNFRSLASTPAKARYRAEALGDLFLIAFDAYVELVSYQAPVANVPVVVGSTSTDACSDFRDVVSSVEDAIAGIDPEAAASETRRFWGLGNGPIPNVVALLEQHGVLVHALPDDQAATIDAFSFWADPNPVVMLNHAKRDPCRSRYDAAHELGHLVMHRHLREVREESSSRQRNGAVEDQANRFAGAFLLPAAEWVRDAPRSTNPFAYLPLKQKWGVSVAAMIVRSSHLGILTEQQYRSAMVRYSQLGWRSKGEPMSGREEHEQPGLFSRLAEAAQAMGVSFAEFEHSLGLSTEFADLLFDSGRKRLNVAPARPNSTGAIDLVAYRAALRERA